ncbi:MAG: hypothetical protein KC483_10445 [Nitrosarchaeum sp.]|nr:hypothetical protein [Nitrosarchaeum sp.]
MSEWDLLNWQTMIIELIIAGVLAVVLSLYFYRRQEKKKKKIDKLLLHQQKIKLERHLHTASTITIILTELKSHFQTLNGLMEYYNITTRRKDLISKPIQIHSDIIVETSQKLDRFVTKHTEDVSIKLESEIQIFLKSISNFDFHNTILDQFIPRSNNIIKTIDSLIELNEDDFNMYKQDSE